MKDTAAAPIRSTCPYCGVGCGVLLTPDGAGGLEVRGDPDHPANQGRLCSKGSALGDTLDMSTRLLAPMVKGVETTWDRALDLVAQKFKDTIAAHGPESVALYVSGQLLTEDYYVANKLAKGYFGTANIDTNSRLCMASSVAGHKRAFGADTVPGTYDDLDAADLIVLTGSNLAWCHPVLYQRILAARKARGTKIVVIDPRRTATCDGAEMHLPLAPGSDVALFNGLLAEIEKRALLNRDFLQNVDGVDAALKAARAVDLSVIGVSDEDLAAFYDLWCTHERVVTIYSQGVNQSTSGADKVNAILNCHLATGRIGREGQGPFSVTGQPNAMGGREVGGLANMLACHMELENAEHRAVVQDFWGVSRVPDAPGKKAVDMFDAVGRGEIKALWIIHTNPAVSMPDADKVAAAIKGCDFVVVSDITGATDTARLADVLLPAAAWAEKSGTVTNSDRTISRQRAVLPLPGRARPDWDILADVGRRMGWGAAFDYETPAEIFREYAALSGLAGQLGRDFDISAWADLTDAEYEALTPTRWPVSAARQGGRFFADGQFFTPDKRGKMLAVAHRDFASKRRDDRAFRLNTGRLRDQWHTMTRTALSPRLSAHLPEPFLEIHPKDAAALGLEPAALVKVTSDHGTAILRAFVTDAVRPGDVFASMHWTGETAPAARIDALVAPNVDPVSGQPESKGSVVDVAAYDAAWYGFAVSAREVAPTAEYWARARTTPGWRMELAGATTPEDWEDYARALFGLTGADVTLQSVSDPSTGTFRFAFFEGDMLIGALFVSRRPTAVMRDYLASLPGTNGPGAISGRAPAGLPDPGPILCSCFGVGVNTITEAIEGQGLMSVEAVGEALQAGTNCGSCRAEIGAILSRRRAPAEAAE